jgi:hypothetical protein
MKRSGDPVGRPRAGTGDCPLVVRQFVSAVALLANCVLATVAANAAKGLDQEHQDAAKNSPG